MFWAQVGFIAERFLEFGNFSRRRLDDRKATGRVGETLAKIFLKSLGYSFIEKNYRSRRGEIDLIMTQGDELVFIEVKSRRNWNSKNLIFDSISLEQKNKLHSTARSYISEKLGRKWRGKYRFDVVGVVFDQTELMEIRLLKNFL